MVVELNLFAVPDLRSSALSDMLVIKMHRPVLKTADICTLTER